MHLIVISNIYIYTAPIFEHVQSYLRKVNYECLSLKYQQLTK